MKSCDKCGFHPEQILSVFGHSPMPSNNCLLVFNCNLVVFKTTSCLKQLLSCFKIPELGITIWGNVCFRMGQVTPPLPKSELSNELFYGR